MILNKQTIFCLIKNIFESKQREAKSYFNANEKINLFYSNPEKIFSYLNEDEETSEIFFSYFDGIY